MSTPPRMPLRERILENSMQKAVAALLGVNPSTISRVLKPRRRVMPTRRSVIIASQYYAGAIDAVKLLKKGDPVTLKTEPDNPADKNAVACFNTDEPPQHLGYIPRTHNLELARLIAGGHVVRARIDEIAEVALNVGAGKLRVVEPPRVEIWW